MSNLLVEGSMLENQVKAIKYHCKENYKTYLLAYQAIEN